MKEITNMGLLELESLSKVYNHVKVLDNINLSVSKGESVALTGHNGAGKSTLIKIIAKLVKPTSGKVTYEDSLRFSYIPEHFPPVSLTAGEYIKSIGRISRMDKRGLKVRSEELFKDFFLQDMVKIPMKHLSKGTLQKIGVVQALLIVPDVLLLDEPLSGQDADSQYVFLQKINLLKQQGVTILMSCHETYLINRIADTIYRIEGGALKKAEVDHSDLKERYTLVFHKSKDAVIPSVILPVALQEGNRCKLTVSSNESKSVILLMLQSGWDLREMCHETNS